MDIVTLPVSIGEALDKLTILDIKCEKIQDGRKADCLNEFTVLSSSLQAQVSKFAYYYKLLREINLEIWDLQDKFHGKDLPDAEAAALCKKILEENDRRFRVKAKLNHAAASTLKEQKGYAKSKVFLYSHLGLGDMFWMNGAVRYLATAYDDVIIVVKEQNKENVRQMYLDDPSISFFVIPDDGALYPFWEKKKQLEAAGMTALACGYHIPGPVYEFPHSFYDDLKMPREIRTRYFHVPMFPEAEALYNVYTGHPYILVHQQSSIKSIPIWDHVNSLNATTLILDINNNHYPEGHPYFALAAQAVGKPLLQYTKLLENATEIHLLESSLYCLAHHLDLSRVTKKVYYSAHENSNERLGIFSSAKLA